MNESTKMLLCGTMIMAVFLAGCTDTAQPRKSAGSSQEQAQSISYTYKKYDLPDKIALGDSSSPNSLYFVFDYTCPWCKKWEQEVLPILKREAMDKGIVKYSAQPIALLSRESLYMAEIDYKLEQAFPKDYYKIQDTFMRDAVDHNETAKSNWGTEDYVRGVLQASGLDPDKVVEKSIKVPDRLNLTRDFTKKKDVQGVPTLYVNGIKIYDPFNIQEVLSVLAGNVKEGSTIIIPRQ